MNKLLKSFTDTYQDNFYTASPIMIAMSTTTTTHLTCLPQFNSLTFLYHYFFRKQLKGTTLLLVSNAMFTSNVLNIVFIFFVGELSSQSFAL